MLDTVDIQGTVVIGEGEMDEAPMLYIGEKVGAGQGEAVDIAVDPVEGTNLVAKGLPGAIAVMAVAPPGCLFQAPDMYMEKIVSGPAGRGVLDITRPIEENLEALADRLGKPMREITVVVLERERHRQLIDAIRRTGARIRLISDGDVAPAVATGLPDSGIDLVVGIGGAPEGVIAAAAVKCLGGEMQARLYPEDDDDRARMAAMGIEDTGRILQLDDLVRGDDVLYVATAITECYGLPGVRYGAHGVVTTHTVVMRSLTGTIRYIVAEHRRRYDV
jgi:fructose-1,6-bisphosphatase II